MSILVMSYMHLNYGAEDRSSRESEKIAKDNGAYLLTHMWVKMEW
jgi:hypothetical protein